MKNYKMEIDSVITYKQITSYEQIFSIKDAMIARLYIYKKEKIGIITFAIGWVNEKTIFMV